MSRASTIIAEVSHVQRMVYVRTRGTCDVYQGYLLVPLKYNIVESWYMYRMTQRLRPMHLRPQAVPLEPSWLYMFLFIITSLNSLTFFSDMYNWFILAVRTPSERPANTRASYEVRPRCAYAYHPSHDPCWGCSHVSRSYDCTDIESLWNRMFL